MNLQLIKAIIILPGTALVFIPGAILWLSAGSPGAMALAEPEYPRFWIGSGRGEFPARKKGSDGKRPYERRRGLAAGIVFEYP